MRQYSYDGAVMKVRTARAVGRLLIPALLATAAGCSKGDSSGPAATVMFTGNKTRLPSHKWRAGQQIQYTRAGFGPVFPLGGEAAVEIGLYRDQERLPLQASDP